MTQKPQSARNMTPAQARKVFTEATRSMSSMPPTQAKRIVMGAVRAARQGQSLKVRKAQANARFREALERGSGLER